MFHKFCLYCLGLVFCLGLLLVNSAQVKAETTLNDNVNFAGELFLNGGGTGINFPDGSRQTSAFWVSWSQIVSENRFELVLGNGAVLDHETGLVWQRDTVGSTYTWVEAAAYCYGLEIGGRRGWRLPTVFELATLLASSSQDPTLPALPVGHPFTNLQNSYWTSTVSEDDSTCAWIVSFSPGGYIGDYSKTGKYVYVRAVRASR